jgi:uncharacterized lipoprotein YajG
MARNLSIQPAILGLVLSAALAAGCAPKPQTQVSPTAPAAVNTAGTDGSAASAKDTTNTLQLEKPE